MQTSRKISEFDLGEVLGVGTVGTIYRAVEKASERLVAIKKLHPSISQDPLIRARFRREMLILERLSHPYIVSYFGGGEDDGADRVLCSHVHTGGFAAGAGTLERRLQLLWTLHQFTMSAESHKH